MEDKELNALAQNARAEIDELRQLAADYREALEELKSARAAVLRYMIDEASPMHSPRPGLRWLHKVLLQEELKELRELGMQLRAAQNALAPEPKTEEERKRRTVELANFMNDQGMPWKDIAQELCMSDRQLRRLRDDYGQSGQNVR